ncbi:hypothetical protein [Calothrix rhizosoleniae]|uniref:hypothetical protein n=1 Tax=Calothrix rhizosoleniae TaxID=888997 RepID=UPI000B4A0B89|nr:hypothetical protein [Calothrix rhizosoleniae]
MARAIEHIEKDIAALEEKISKIAQELQAAYTSYLNSLAQVMRQQVILASYYLCTQGYPSLFLQLSLSQRQKLQQMIRKASQKAAEKLISLTNTEQMQVDDSEQRDILINYLQQVQAHSNQQEEELEAEEPESESLESEELEPESPEAESTEVEEPESEGIRYEKIPFPLNLLSLKTYSPDTSNPVELLKWQQQIEARILANLKHISSEVNNLLKNADILPSKLPQPILEAAAIASATSGEMMPGPPNILNLVVEMDKDEESEESSLTQIMAVNLRLGEIEFADSQLSSLRKQIRLILGRLHKLGREYQHKQREHSIAEAEAAWRASWYED